MESAVSFAPLRPADFVNFAGRGKACFLRGGAACFSAGRGVHPCFLRNTVPLQGTFTFPQKCDFPPVLGLRLFGGGLFCEKLSLVSGNLADTEARPKSWERKRNS